MDWQFCDANPSLFPGLKSLVGPVAHADPGPEPVLESTGSRRRLQWKQIRVYI